MNEDRMTEQKIWEMFQVKRNKVDILLEALDYMQQWNGRSKWQCIGLAMGLTQKQAYNEEDK
jgi:hypothetical protein